MADGNGPGKRPVNVTISRTLLADAKAAGLNLSAILENALRRDISNRRLSEWRSKNRDAIERSNEELAANGMWQQPGWLDR